MSERRNNRSGFTVVEMLLAVMAFLLLTSIVMIGVAQQQAKRRDVMRSAAIVQLQKALALYSSDSQEYPSMKGCIDGHDLVTTELISRKLLDPEAKLYDPRSPDDLTSCFLYESGGSSYTIRYTMETDTVSSKGEHVASP